MLLLLNSCCNVWNSCYNFSYSYCDFSCLCWGFLRIHIMAFYICVEAFHIHVVDMHLTPPLAGYTSLVEKTFWSKAQQSLQKQQQQQKVLTNVNNGWALFAGKCASEPAHLNGMQLLQNKWVTPVFYKLKRVLWKGLLFASKEPPKIKNKWMCEWWHSAGKQPFAG